MKTLSNAEYEDQRRRGLCFWYDEKFSPRHWCPKRDKPFQFVLTTTMRMGMGMWRVRLNLRYRFMLWMAVRVVEQ